MRDRWQRRQVLFVILHKIEYFWIQFFFTFQDFKKPLLESRLVDEVEVTVVDQQSNIFDFR